MKNIGANQKDIANIRLVIGISGIVSGLFLLFSEQWFIGISETIASAGIAVKG